MLQSIWQFSPFQVEKVQFCTRHQVKRQDSALHSQWNFVRPQPEFVRKKDNYEALIEQCGENFDVVLLTLSSLE